MLSSLVALAACAGGTPTTTTRHALASEAVELESMASTAWAQTHELDATLEHKLDAAIQTGLGSRDNAVVTAHALVQWSRLVRRHLPEPLHTAVPGVGDDPDCAGSVIGDGALIGYVAAVGTGEEDVTGASASLQTLARHLACLGEAQTAQLATYMTVAYDDVASALTRNGRVDALPYVAQAIAQPMLLVQDVDRQRGRKAPLARWFRAHADILREGAGGLHHPARWHGLWLYDRSLGRLVGFKVTLREERASENSVDIAALYDTLAAAKLDDNACSLEEMVHRGRGPDGRYWCAAQACARLDSPDCHVGMSGDVDQGSGGGIALATPGLATTELLSCVAAQVVKPGQRQMQCVLEASGHAASPYEQLVKELTTVSLAGVKLGNGCTLSQQAGDDPYAAAEQAARDRYAEELAGAQKELHDRNERLIEAQRARDKAYEEYGADDPRSQEAEAAVDEAEAAVNAGIATYDETVEEAAAARDEELEEIQKEREEDAANTNSQCVQGASCGNGCGAMARQAAAFAKCFADSDMTIDPYRAGCGLDCDPSEPTSATPASASCITSLEVTTPASIQARECWSSRCASSSANDGCCGAGGHATTGAPSLPDLCGIALCDGGSAPTLNGGSCGCGSMFDAPGGAQLPYGPPPRR